jgi:hypothetical protein
MNTGAAGPIGVAGGRGDGLQYERVGWTGGHSRYSHFATAITSAAEH